MSSNEFELWHAYRIDPSAEHVERLLMYYEHVVRQLARRRPPRLSFEDAVAAGRRGLLRAVKAFDARRGQFAVFCRKHVLGEISSECGHDDRQTTGASFALETAPARDDPPPIDGRRLWAAIRPHLNADDQRLLKLHYLDGVSLAEIARRRRQPVRKLRYRLKTTLNHLRDRLADRADEFCSTG